MKKIIFMLILASGTLYGAFYSYSNVENQPLLALEFVCGLVLGILIMNIWLHVKNSKINKYKRALEKETISSSENSSRVKVLESKIEVLEKALQDAIQNK